MLVGDICNRTVVSINPQSSIQDTVKLMRDQHVGCVVVVNEQDNHAVPVGVVTDRDIVIEVLAEEVDIAAVTVGDIMSDDLLSACETDRIDDVLAAMRHRGVRRVPVVNDKGGLISVLAVDDLIEYFAARLMDVSILFTNEFWKEERARP